MKDIYNKIISEKHIGKETNPINQKDILSLAGHYSRNYENKSNGIGLVIVNVQRDFIDPKKGALPVKGSVKDVKRIIRFIYENLEDIYSIYTAMDTHYYDSIFHPYMWQKPNGEEIEPFTEVTLDKINLFRVLYFSYLVGNTDMHLKNFSLIDDDGYHLSPFYDLTSPEILVNQNEMALSLNGKRKKLTKNDFLNFAINISLDKELALKLMKNINIKLKKCYPYFVDTSFLNEDLKKNFINLIEKRMDNFKV